MIQPSLKKMGDNFTFSDYFFCLGLTLVSSKTIKINGKQKEMSKNHKKINKKHFFKGH